MQPASATGHVALGVKRVVEVGPERAYMMKWWYVKRFTLFLLISSVGLITLSPAALADTNNLRTTQVISLDGPWLAATDSDNHGRDEQWWTQPTGQVRAAPVPGVIENIFPGYHGLVWYWRKFTVSARTLPNGRIILRFWNVDYQASVWLNGHYIGQHEGAEGLFTFDVTDTIKTDGSNLLAVRLLNPADKPIDGIVLQETPHRNKTCAFTFGHDYNHGGIEDSVELLAVPAVWIKNLFVQPDPHTGVIAIQATIQNSSGAPTTCRLDLTAAPAYSSGLFLAVHKFGAGRFILNTLLIRTHLNDNPVAERLLRNLLIYAATQQEKPLAPLPADFSNVLQKIGYTP